ncbi:Mannose-P-dolichol utilization defect 1 protein [Seminavis robusta]|uniref:Mannose-P-dolichol utilization defect 1 protein n=1 Tax=Seminavis robusta TaxID=568900 RepID=A0A9N8H702_9STRA|nr:Mannose-P-dolichol utilization defect 1 protein [Seminavis robusta]|eukprot:Sro187_g080900.1 Mannose-P-dolichol utilization defect 1 protein (336) ;mRNA; f:37184-38462
MISLSSLPLVTPLARWMWTLDAEDSTTTTAAAEDLYVTCLHQVETLAVYDFATKGCLSVAASRILGIGIIVAACFNKAPTLMNMLEAQSAEGFSPMSLYTEVFYYINSSIYSVQLGYPFTAYGENLVLLIQTMVQVVLMWKFSKTSPREQAIATLLGVVYSAACCFLPQGYRYLLHAMNDVIIIYSGGLQVMETYRVKHTGAQSIVTTSMNLAGELLRIFTTFEEAQGDWNMILNFAFCASISVMMFSQYWWYQANTDKFYKQQQPQRQAALKTPSDEQSNNGHASIHIMNSASNGSHDNMQPPESLKDLKSEAPPKVLEDRFSRSPLKIDDKFE